MVGIKVGFYSFSYLFLLIYLTAQFSSIQSINSPKKPQQQWKPINAQGFFRLKGSYSRLKGRALYIDDI